MQYEAISTANESLQCAMELMARELTNATRSGYTAEEGILVHHFDAEFGKHVLTRFIYKPEKISIDFPADL